MTCPPLADHPPLSLLAPWHKCKAMGWNEWSHTWCLAAGAAKVSIGNQILVTQSAGNADLLELAGYHDLSSSGWSSSSVSSPSSCHQNGAHRFTWNFRLSDSDIHLLKAAQNPCSPPRAVHPRLDVMVRTVNFLSVLCRTMPFGTAQPAQPATYEVGATHAETARTPLGGSM